VTSLENELGVGNGKVYPSIWEQNALCIPTNACTNIRKIHFLFEYLSKELGQLVKCQKLDFVNSEALIDMMTRKLMS